eukprot:9360378-Pyramimonas_sp.AAC.1
MLCAEELRFTACCIRSTEEHKFPGGMSEVMKVILLQFLGRGVNRPDLRDGVVLRLGEDRGPRLVHGDIAALLADERGHKFSLQAKGAAGHKTCLLCKNVLNKFSSWLSDLSGYCVDALTTDVALFDPHTKAPIYGIQQRLREIAASGANSELLERQRTLGFNWVPTGMLQEPSLSIDIPEVLAWDYVHIYLVKGLFHVELTALLNKLAPHGFGGLALDKYLQNWEWPGACGTGKA